MPLSARFSLPQSGGIGRPKLGGRRRRSGNSAGGERRAGSRAEGEESGCPGPAPGQPGRAGQQPVRCVKPIGQRERVRKLSWPRHHSNFFCRPGAAQRGEISVLTGLRKLATGGKERDPNIKPKRWNIIGCLGVAWDSSPKGEAKTTASMATIAIWRRRRRYQQVLLCFGLCGISRRHLSRGISRQ